MNTRTLPIRSTAAIACALSSVALFAAYVRLTQPTVFGPSLSAVAAGGGVIGTADYLALLALVGMLAASFVLVGYLACQHTGLFAVTTLVPRDIGMCYFVGMAVFLAGLGSLAAASGLVVQSAAAMVLAFGAGSIWCIRSQQLLARAAAWTRRNARVIALLSPLAVTALCFSHYVVTSRSGAGTGWFYHDFSRHVVALNSVPLVNRHYAQSLLSSVGLFVVGIGDDRSTFPQAALDDWLFVSQLALVIVFNRVLGSLGVSALGCRVGTLILMVGNTALSLLPHIVSDHDYPFVMNVYTDSLFGVAGWLLLVLYLIERSGGPAQAAGPLPWRTLAVPALVVYSFNATSELNILVVLALIISLSLLNLFRRWTRFSIPNRELAAMLLVFSAAGAAGTFQGGVFASYVATAERRTASPFWESDAAAKSSRMSVMEPRWWYLPHIVLGLPSGFGNLPVAAAATAEPGTPAATTTLESPGTQSVAIAGNSRLLDRFAGVAAPAIYRFVDAVYLIELRAYQALRVLWFPLAGMLMLGVLVARDRGLAHLRSFWWIAAISFGAGLSGVILANSEGGDAFYWKWGLTRLLEPGLCLAMIAFVVAVDRLVVMQPSRLTRYGVWAALTGLMAFGTLLRIFAYPTFNG